MAVTLADPEFWLPSDFLTDHDFLLDKENFTRNPLLSTQYPHSDICFPTDFPYEFHSSSATESESDDDDIHALTRQFSRTTLGQPQKISHPTTNLEKWVFSGSPQSTLSTVGSWSVSSNGSPNGPSQGPSPPTTPFPPIENSRDLIYAAVEQVARMKMQMNGAAQTKNRGLLGNPLTVAPLKYPNNCLSHPLCGPNPHFHQVSKEQPESYIWGFPEQQVSGNRAVRNGHESERRCGGKPLGLPQSAWPPLHVQNQRRVNQPQQNSGSTMKAVFLGGLGGGGGGCGGIKRECAGTGVFLPRRYSTPSESRKKPGCSVALLPARVVQALNKNLDPTIFQAQAQAQTPSPYNGGFLPNYEELLAQRNAILGQQKRSHGMTDGPAMKHHLNPAMNHRLHPAMNHQELRLPQEWTY